MLAGGGVAQVGTPRELYQRPANRAVAEFLGDANLLDATVLGPGRVRCALGDLATASALPAAGAPVTLCVRPERIHLDAGGDGLAATISAGQYFGGSASWTLRCGEVVLSASEAAPPERRPGDGVRLRIAAEDVVALPA